MGATFSVEACSRSPRTYEDKLARHVVELHVWLMRIDLSRDQLESSRVASELLLAVDIRVTVAGHRNI